MFGDPIGSYAGESMVGARDASAPCSECGMMPLEIEAAPCSCGAQESAPDKMCDGCGMPVDQCVCDQASTCPACGMMPLELGGGCECSMTEAKKGPSKKTAKKILKGAVTATQKAKKVDSWATNPWAAANWMSQQAGVPLHGKEAKKKK